MNVGIIGYGSIARDHALAITALRRTPEGRDLRLHAVMGPHLEPTEAFQREFGMTAATRDIATFVADPLLDAIVVCSPSPAHAEQTEQCLRAGKHVLCEIPLALSLAETDRLTLLADEVDRRLMVCHTQRYGPAMIEAKRLVASGSVHPHAIVARYMFGRRENVNWRGRRRSWTDNLLWHHGCHAVDAALWLLGVPERGEAVATVAQVALPGADLGIPMDLSLAMRTERDQLVTVAMSYHTHIPVNDYLIIGDATTLLLEDRSLWDRDTILIEASSLDPSDIAAPIARQDAEFFEAIREARQPAISGSSVRPAMAALQVAQDSLDSRLAARSGEGRHPREP